MARAALAFLGALDSRRRRQATFPFAHAERQNWHYVPRRREGVPLKDMAADARTAALALLQVGLSAAGYAKARDVLRLEGVLRQLETFGGFTRDPDNYAVTIFGAPEQPAPWGWRFEGHHLSLNFTVAPGRAIAVTPAFFGANPAEVPSGPLKGLRVLQAEQDLGLALAGGLDPGQRARATIAAESLGDIVSGPGRGESLRTPAGVPLGDLGAESRALAVRLLETYARNMRADLAESGAPEASRGGARAGPLRVGGSGRPEASALLPPPRADAAHRVRQHPERREPHPLGLARSPRRLRRRPAGRPLPDASRSRLAGGGADPPSHPAGSRRAGGRTATRARR